MLVNIYGSKDLFVKEYTNLLAQRLLTATNNDTEKEYRYLELLKLRYEIATSWLFFYIRLDKLGTILSRIGRWVSIGANNHFFVTLGKAKVHTL